MPENHSQSLTAKPVISLNQGELDAFEMLPRGSGGDAIRIYLKIKKFVDGDTRVAGVKRKFCRAGFAEEVAGNEDRVKYLLKKLVGVGLLEKQKEWMVYKLPLADFGQNLTKNKHPEPYPKACPERAHQAIDSVRLVVDNDKDSTQNCTQDRTPLLKDLLQQQQGIDSDPSFHGLKDQDVDIVVDSYHEAFPSRHKVGNRRDPELLDLIAAYWHRDPKHRDPEWWQWYWQKCKSSDFLMGRQVLNQRKGPFKVNIKFLLKPRTFNKLACGAYT